MKRLQIYIPEEMDAALAVQAAGAGRSKADLIREYVAAGLPAARGHAEPLDELVGMFDGAAGGSASVDDVVYPR